MRPSAFNGAPFARRGLLVALGLSELTGICEQDGLGGVIAVATFGPPVQRYQMRCLTKIPTSRLFLRHYLRLRRLLGSAALKKMLEKGQSILLRAASC